MSATTYDIGDTVRMQTSVTSSTGPIASTVRLIVNKPDGSVVVKNSSQLTNSALGTYRYDLRVDIAGRWTYQFDSTGAVISSEGDAFAVRPKRAST